MAIGAHFYTTSEAERDHALAVFGYVDEGIACFLPTVRTEDTTGLARLFKWSTSDHFYTTYHSEVVSAVNSFGYVDENISYLVFGPPGEDRKPLYRLCDYDNGHHFYTISEIERDDAVANHNYTKEGIACYVFESKLGDRIPLFRLRKAADLKSFVRLHLKVLTPPDIPISAMLKAMRQVYTTAGIRVDVIPFNSYAAEGTACFVFPFQAMETTNLFRLYNPVNGDHFYTTSTVERDNAAANLGYVREDAADTTYFAFTSPGHGRVALYRLFNPNSGDHFYTTSEFERDNAWTNLGYVKEGIACFVFDSWHPGTVPFFRLYDSSNGDHFYTTSQSEAFNATVTELLDLPLLTDLDDGPCDNGTVTAESTSLFSNRNNVVASHDIVAYFIRSTNGVSGMLNGCAVSPPGQPGCVVTQGASVWTLGHEVGHVLGLSHVDTKTDCTKAGFVPTRLMTGCGTARIMGVPILSEAEMQTMDESDLTIDIGNVIYG